MTTPMRILAPSTPVCLVAKLDAQKQLQLYHRDTPLSQHDDGLEIVLESKNPVTVEVLDFEDDTGGKWTVGVAGSALDKSSVWDRGDGLCRAAWGETSGEVGVYVTASNGTSASVKRPIFIKVLPEGSKPWA
jgi:hypothetical protein